MFEIAQMDKSNVADVNDTNDYFSIYGRIVPIFQNGKWSHTEELFEEIKETKFPDDNLDWDEYINNEDKTIFFVYRLGMCVGQIRMVKQVNKFCYIENIAVIQPMRKSGVGTMLIEIAEKWAKEKGLSGLSLEAQDDNLAACRFYVKQGFEIGGIDTLVHLNNPNIDKAIYWYKVFNKQ